MSALVKPTPEEIARLEVADKKAADALHAATLACGTGRVTVEDVDAKIYARAEAGYLLQDARARGQLAEVVEVMRAQLRSKLAAMAVMGAGGTKQTH